MDNGTMFQNLMGYKGQSFYDEHPTAHLLTPSGAYTVEFFAGYVTGLDGNAKAKSSFESPVTPIIADEIVTLSTCSYEFYNARFVLHGRLIQK